MVAARGGQLVSLAEALATGGGGEQLGVVTVVSSIAISIVIRMPAANAASRAALGSGGGAVVLRPVAFALEAAGEGAAQGLGERAQPLGDGLAPSSVEAALLELFRIAAAPARRHVGDHVVGALALELVVILDELLGLLFRPTCAVAGARHDVALVIGIARALRHRAAQVSIITLAVAAGGAGGAGSALVAAAFIVAIDRFDDVADLGELLEIDLALADQLKDDLAEVGEQVGAPAVAQSSARAALEGLAHRAGLLERGAEQAAEGASEVGAAAASTAARRSCHGAQYGGGVWLSPVRELVYVREVVRGLFVLMVFGACSTVEVPVTAPPVSKGTVRIRSFTEPSAARELRSTGGYVFAVTGRGLERWSRDGNVVELSTKSGLASDDVLATAVDSERKALWILTPGSIGRYGTSTEVFTQLDPPLEDIDLDLDALAPTARAALAAADDGGVWIGTPQGLHYASSEGWSSTSIKEAVVALATSPEGLFIARERGLVLRDAAGDLVPIGPEQGCAVTRVTQLLSVPKLGGTLAIGSDERGAPRLAIGRGQEWHSFRVLPSMFFERASADGERVLLLGGGQVFRLTLRDQSEAQPLTRDGVRLSAMSSTAPDLVLTAAAAVLPPGALSAVGWGEQLLVGTRDLGVARFLDGESRPSSWLRRRQMFVDATSLSVACSAPDDCWLATGSRSAWHWNGERFTAGGPDEAVLAMARDRNDALYALHRNEEGNAILLSRVEPTGQWTALPRVAIETRDEEEAMGAEPPPEVSFARFGPSGALWVGLRHRQGGELRPWGVAIVDVSSGKVQYHHAQSDQEGARGEAGKPADEAELSRRAGEDDEDGEDDDKPARKVASRATGIPPSVMDADGRGDATWFATRAGVARLSTGALKLWDSSNGLRSELTRAIAVSRGNAVFVATSSGVARFDGSGWQFPLQLSFEANDLAVTAGGLLWMATARGVAIYDGSRVRRVDMRRGLVENDVLDLAVDRYDRIWARGPGSLTLIAPGPGATAE